MISNLIKNILLHNYDIDSDNIEFYINDVKVEKDEKIKKGDSIKGICDDKVNLIRLTINNEEKEIYHKKDKFIFVDIFDYIDFDLSRLQGELCLKINGKDAEYMEELKDGDKIIALWE